MQDSEDTSSIPAERRNEKSVASHNAAEGGESKDSASRTRKPQRSTPIDDSAYADLLQDEAVDSKPRRQKK